jgi:hypothetical protein
MTTRDRPSAPRPALSRPGLSRRRLLGGALTAALAAALVPRDRAVTPRPPRFAAKTRWIGHA